MNQEAVVQCSMSSLLSPSLSMSPLHCDCVKEEAPVGNCGRGWLNREEEDVTLVSWNPIVSPISWWSNVVRLIIRSYNQSHIIDPEIINLLLEQGHQIDY